jgi:hypothetical protein
MADEPIVQRAHKFQLVFVALALSAVVRIVAFFGGLQSGKSVAGADALRELLYGENALRLPPQAKGQVPEVWILSKTYVLAQSALNTFKWRAGHCFFSDNECRQLGLKRGDSNSYWLKPSPNGDGVPIMLRVRTAHDPEALRATPVLLAAWCDEMAHWPEMAWTNLQGRGIVTHTKYVITTTPKGKNWLHREVLIPGEENEKENPNPDIVPPDEKGWVRVVKCRSVDNPWADKKYVQSLRKKFGENYAQQELDGLFISSSGLVYPLFDRFKHLKKPPSLNPDDYPIRIIGADPGYGDPYACGVWLRDKDRVWWLVDELYIPSAAITDDLIPWFAEMKKKWNIQKIWVDKRRDSDAKLLRKNGFNAQPNLELYYEKSRLTILPMARCVETIMSEGRIRIHPDCEWTIDEFENYSYPDREARNRGENPVDYKNHAMDAMRYAIVSIEGANYAGPGVLFSTGPRGDYAPKKPKKPFVKLQRTLGQSIAVVERMMDEKEKERGPRQF